ncbi:MAG: TonB-dependent receptor [Kangiellaceae bacterium]|nr:TonB-dependent receptor [Kangiellaceae bacterium]
MKHNPLYLALLTATSIISTPVLANDDVADDEAYDQNRITVTANRRDYVDTDLAMSVHSVDEEQMAIDNGQHPAESLNSLAGVYIDQLNSGQGHKTAIRMPINVDGYYLFLQDNIPLQSPAFFNHNAMWWSSFNSGVNRLEVLKGAGTALHGSGAVAATINILSEPVNFDSDTSMSATFGEDSYYKLQATTSDRIDDNSGYRASASHFNNDGWRDHTGSVRSEVNFRHELELDSSSRLVTLFTASNLEQEMAGSLSEDQYAQDPTQAGLSDTVLAVDPTRTTEYVRLSTQWDKMDGNVSYSVIPYLRHRTNDYTATWNKNMPAVESSVDTFGILSSINIDHMNDSETTFGIDIEITEGDQYSFQPYDITTTGWGADTYLQGEVFFDDTTSFESFSPFIQHTRELTENLDLTLGARYDYATYEFDNHLTMFGDIGHGNLSLNDRDDSFKHLSPKLSLNYHFGEDSSLFFRFANSFRLPTAGSLYHLTTSESDEGISSLDPEVSDTYEVGYKTNLENLTFDFAIYYMDVDDGIVHAYNANGQRYLVNASRVIHKGIELATLWKVSEQIEVSAAYTQTKHEYDEYEDFSGNEMMNAPENFANFRIQYKPQSIAELTTLIEVQNIGDYWMDDANTEKQSGFTLVNFKSLYKVSESLSLNARINNLTDKEYLQNAIIRYGRAQLYPAPPRSIFLGFKYQW